MAKFASQSCVAVVFAAVLGMAVPASAQSPSELFQRGLELIDPDNADANVSLGIELLSQSADRGYARSLQTLGEFYINPESPGYNLDRGINYLKEVVAGGRTSALMALAEAQLRAGQNEDAVASLEAAAETGNSGAIRQLADVYETGELVSKDLAKAFEYYRTAAEAGNTGAKRKVAAAYLNGIGTDRDPAAAISLLEDLSAAGDSRSTFQLAELLIDGAEGVSVDSVRGYALLTRLADAGDARAQFELAEAYLAGSGIEKNETRGRDWLLKAAEAGLAPAIIRQAEFVAEDGDRAAAIALLAPLADDGNVGAQMALGNIYSTGTDPESVEKALEYYELAKEQGNSQAVLKISDLLLGSDGAITSDAGDVLALLESEAEGGNTQALTRLVRIYLGGETGSTDKEKGLRFLNRLAESDTESAQLFVGQIYLNGELVDMDPVRAIGHLDAALNKGSTRAARILAKTYQTGTGVPQDAARGFSYLEQAASLGDISAKRSVANALLKGDDVAEDPARGIALLEEVALATRSERDSFQVGRYYFADRSNPESLAKAIDFFKIAADQGNSRAASILGDLYFRGRDVPLNYAVAERYYKIAIEAGDKRGLARLGDILMRNRDTTRAIALYREAAEQGSPEGTFREAIAYLNTKRFPGKLPTALSMLNTLSNEGFDPATIRLAQIYSKGKPVAADLPKALAYYDKAVASENSSAAAQRLVLLSQINSEPDSFADIITAFDALSLKEQKSFVRSGFAQAPRQVAYIVQSRLADKGFYTSVLDGLFGAGSQAAMSRFCLDDALNGPCATPVWSPANAMRVIERTGSAEG